MKKLLLTFILFTSFISKAQEKRKLFIPMGSTHFKNSDNVGVSFSFFPKSNPYKDYQENYTNTYGLQIDACVLAVLYPLVAMAPSLGLSKNKKEHNEVMKWKKSYKNIYGINLSTGSFEDLDVYGISISAIGSKTRKVNGISLTAFLNLSESVNGGIIGFINTAYECKGISIGLRNDIKFIEGLQIGGMNDVEKTKGLQTGLYNNSKELNGIQISFDNHILQKGNGIQIGIYNKAKNFKGIQLGLWNKNQKRSLPIINWNF